MSSGWSSCSRWLRSSGRSCAPASSISPIMWSCSRGSNRSFARSSRSTAGSSRSSCTSRQACAVFLAALAGPGLVAPDLANNALPLYFSRPLTRWSYALSRLTVIVGMLSVVTWIPGLLLFGLQVGLAGGWWFVANWTLGAGVVAGFLLWLLVLGLVAMASSAYVKWRVVAGALSLAFFFILTGVSEMIDEVFRVTWGHVLDPAWAVNRVWCTLLGVDPPEGPGAGASMLALTGFVLLLVLVIERKLRPVEVVR